MNADIWRNRQFCWIVIYHSQNVIEEEQRIQQKINKNSQNKHKKASNLKCESTKLMKSKE